MRREIDACMKDLEALSPSGLSARFSFPQTFAGFQGHFDGNPVLPGICKVMAVLAMFEKNENRAYRLAEINQAKYFTPVSFNEELTVKCDSKRNDDGTWSVKAAFQKDEAKVALLQMVIEHA